MSNNSGANVKPASRAGRPSKAEVERTRARILEAAVDLFNDLGYVRATTGDIAERAGVTKRTLYRHMKTKERMLAEIHRDFLDVGLQRWEAVLARHEEPAETLAHLIEQHLTVLRDYRRAIRVFFESLKYLSPEGIAEVRVRRKEYQRALVELVKRGQESGAFNPGDPVVRSMLILGTLNSGYNWYDPTARTADGTPWDKFVADVLCNGLRGQAGEPALAVA